MHGFNKPTRADAQAPTSSGQIKKARRPKPSPKFLEQFYAWMYQVHHDPELPPSALAVLLEIAWPMSSLGQCAWPSLETIAENCGLSKSTIVELVQKLVARGHLLAEGGKPGRGHSTRYQINIIGTEPKAAPEAQAMPPLKGFVADLLDADPMPVKGTLADLLEPGTGSIKGTLADLNKNNTSRMERGYVPPLSTDTDRVPDSLRDDPERLPELPQQATIEAAFPKITETVCAPVGATTEFDRNKIINPRVAGESFYIRGGGEIGDGGAATGAPRSLFPPRRHGFSSGILPQHKPEEPTMPKPAPDPVVLAAADAFFAALLEAYPRRDSAEPARAALHAVLSEADDPGQLRCCLLDAVNEYVADMRAADKHGFMSLRAFITDGELWRPEFLPFNVAQAMEKAA